ncbi:hypothetical protein M8J77_006799 [Diaphorina citri]|nr:hypothetical protein M8J77_006799 [Diaphorina citri]
MLCRVPSPYFAHVKVCSSEMKVRYSIPKQNCHATLELQGKMSDILKETLLFLIMQLEKECNVHNTGVAKDSTNGAQEAFVLKSIKAKDIVRKAKGNIVFY